MARPLPAAERRAKSAKRAQSPPTALAAQAHAQAQTTHAEAAAVIARLQRDGYRPEPNPESEAPTPEPAAANTAATVSEHEHGDRPARLDALQARTDQAAHRIAVGNAAREAREQYTAAVNAKPTPKPSRRPNARPKPWTGSRWSYRSSPHRRGPVPGPQHAHGSDRGDGQVDVWHDFRSEFARAFARRPAFQ